MNSNPIVIRSKDVDGAEVAWFAPLCDEDCQYLGTREPIYKSTFGHTSDILCAADRYEFDNILCPSSFQVGQDTLSFVSAVAPKTKQLSLLAAVRCGELHPPMLARTLAGIDHMLDGRLTVNIISSDLPGETLSSEKRYQRSREVIEILKQFWTQEEVNFEGQFYKLSKLPAAPGKPYQQNGGPLLYFGGMSPPALDLAAQHCDVFLMWPETKERLHATMTNMSQKAMEYDRKLDFGLRIHVIVRETEEEAREAANKLVSKLDDAKGAELKSRSLDAKSLGVSRQSEMRDLADSEGFIEPNIWTGIGRARSGCGSAIVGDPDQVYNKIQEYIAMGMRAFIFSGYPHRAEIDLFAKYVLPRLKQARLARVQQRIPTSPPMTPLALGERK